MDQMDTSYPTIINATEDYLKSQVAEKDARIVALEEHSQRVTQRDFDTRAKLESIRNDMQEWTLEAMDNDTIDESVATEIAEICGFDLTKEFELEVTVLYSITVNARNEEEAHNVIHDIDFDTVQYSDENISWLNASVDRIDS
jgi:hypothetical protein